jgi:transketolase
MDDIVSTLKSRITRFAYDHKMSHIGSCLTALPVLVEIFETKRPDDLFVLSSGHAGFALYTVLEHYTGVDAGQMYEDHGVHPHRDPKRGIECSAGSLGCGITIAVGLALANPAKTVYVLLSDGECAEGSVWESLAFITKQKIQNIKVYVNANGYAAYESVDVDNLECRLQAFLPDVQVRRTESMNKLTEQVDGLLSHYYVLKPSDAVELGL